MCYSVYLSTDSGEDLSGRNSELVRFERVAEATTNPCVSLLDFTQRWYVGSKSGCSCTFRHLHSIELGFSDPVDWYPEEQEELEATQELYGVLIDLLSSGYRVDLIDVWQGTQPHDVTVLEVSLQDVQSTAFRMFENHKFALRMEEP